jgi:peroxiredoxin Q/BCP
MQIYLVLAVCAVMLASIGCSSGTGEPVKVGDPAPDFSLPDNLGATVDLKSLRGKIVVLFFYPKDNTSICTKEACLFRDNYETFLQLGATVLGVSSDSQSSHGDFAEKHNLKFPLLSDEGGKLRALYGVPKTFGLLPGRVTYVIDGAGVVRQVFNSQTNAGKHVEEALNMVRSLAGTK